MSDDVHFRLGALDQRADKQDQLVVDHETRIRRLEEGQRELVLQISKMEATITAAINGVLADAINAVPREVADRNNAQAMWLTAISILLALVVGAASIIVALKK